MTYSLSYCVNSVLADLEMPPSKGYLRLLKFAIDAFRRLNLAGQLPTVKTAELVIDKHTNTAILPQDYVSFTKVGICCRGHFINFDIDDTLCLKAPELPSACACSSEEIAATINQCCGGSNVNGEGGGQGIPGSYNDAVANWFYPYYSHWHNGQFVAGYYGAGAGFRHGGYKINQEAGIIQFDACINVDTVVLEYIATGIDGDGDAQIPQGAIGAICAYIHERNCALSRDNAVKSMTSYWNRKWVSESSAFVKRNNAMGYTEWVLLFREHTYAVPKR